MALHSNKVFVTSSWGPNKLYVLNATTDVVADSIILTDFATSIEKDADNKLWVFVDSTAANPAKALRINPDNHTIEQTLDFAVGKSPIKSAISGNGRKIYYTTSDGLFSFDITATSLPAAPIKSGFFYGLGVDPSEGSVYISDALDFNQKGVVYRFTSSGDTLNFKAGIIPGGFFFNN